MPKEQTTRNDKRLSIYLAIYRRFDGRTDKHIFLMIYLQVRILKF